MLTYKKDRFDDLYFKKIEDISKVKPNDIKDSKWFKSDAYDAYESSLHTKQTKGLAIFYFIIFGLVCNAFSITPLYYDSVKFRLLTLPIFLALYASFVVLSFLAAALTKHIIYCIVAKVHGYEVLTAMDEFYLYDMPVNPINMGSIFTFNRPIDQKPEEVLETIIKRIGDYHRVKVKIIKRYHRYFYQVLNEEEKKKWMRSNCGVIDDIKTD